MSSARYEIEVCNSKKLVTKIIVTERQHALDAWEEQRAKLRKGSVLLFEDDAVLRIAVRNMPHPIDSNYVLA